jgi:hypothetical protein
MMIKYAAISLAGLGILVSILNAMTGETRHEIMGWTASGCWAMAYLLSWLRA